jgi:D-alanyl-lipoteichoic acid acyltransferase DltB (MBOAT superfamily)
MTWGMFKKVVVADRLAIYVDSVYSDPSAHQGLPVVAATYFFAFQIYCDFSGYSDIAIGAARVLGFDLMENFKRPYLARSVSEFWRRWHISLSTWFRDYVYIPLGGNRAGVSRWYVNLAITFLVSGLWHGANWTFVVWGALHGFYLIFSIVTGGLRERVLAGCGLGTSSRGRSVFDVLVTFHLALLAWVFFRADSLGDALLLFAQAGEGLTAQVGALLSGDLRLAYQSTVVAVGIGKSEFLLSLLAVVFVYAVDLFVERGGLEVNTPRRRILRFAWYDLLILLTLLLGAFGQQQFIYFQF